MSFIPDAEEVSVKKKTSPKVERASTIKPPKREVKITHVSRSVRIGATGGATTKEKALSFEELLDAFAGSVAHKINFFEESSKGKYPCLTIAGHKIVRRDLPGPQLNVAVEIHLAGKYRIPEGTERIPIFDVNLCYLLAYSIREALYEISSILKSTQTPQLAISPEASLETLVGQIRENVLIYMAKHKELSSPTEIYIYIMPEVVYRYFKRIATAYRSLPEKNILTKGPLDIIMRSQKANLSSLSIVLHLEL